MNWNRVEENWKELKGNIEGQLGHLTDDDLAAIAGRLKEVERMIQERCGTTKWFIPTALRLDLCPVAECD
jgi:uncharacterized protein YjbJ (UPF0337 family)